MTKDRARVKAGLYIKWANIAEKKSHDLYEAFNATHKDFDWTQPILRGHHSQKRHEKLYSTRDTMFRKVRELDDKAKRFREKAENLLHFANTNKGDAERKREAKRQEIKSSITIGSKVSCMFWKEKIFDVVKINAKTARIKCGEHSTLQPIQFLELI